MESSKYMQIYVQAEDINKLIKKYNGCPKGSLTVSGEHKN